VEEYLIKESIEALKIHLAEYLNTVWKTMAFIMVALGWILSSKDAREFLASHRSIRYSALIVIVLLAIAHFSTLSALYKKSKRTKKALGEQLDGLLSSVVNSYAIPKTYPFASIVINGLLYSSLFGIIAAGLK
jgi:hypothetical protein